MNLLAMGDQDRLVCLCLEVLTHDQTSVQVGSFLDKGRALTLIDDLKGSGQYAYVIETTGADGQKYYRVRVGQMSSLASAEDLKKHFDKLGYPTLIYP